MSAISATTAGALKAYVEGLGLGLTCFRDAAPSTLDTDGQRVPSVPYPYVTIREALFMAPNLDGDQSDPAAALTVREDVALDLWQRWRTGLGKVSEDYTLADPLLKALRNARVMPLIGAVGHVYGLGRVSVVRLLEPDRNVVHHAYTCTVHRAI